MYQGRYQAKHLERRKKRRIRKRIATLAVSLLLLVTMAVGGTLAYLFMSTDQVENTFTPSQVSCEVTETFDGTTKSGVNVTNTSNTSAYIRVKLVSYRVNEEGQQIGGTATVPTFTPVLNWVYNEDDGFYYYTSPVEPGKEPATDLFNGSITLEDNYEDADGGKQVIEVMAEAIQALGTDDQGRTPTQLAWGVTISIGSVTAYTGE